MLRGFSAAFSLVKGATVQDGNIADQDNDLHNQEVRGMSSERKLTKKVYTLATAIGLALGTMGIAAAASTPAATTTTTTTTQPEVTSPPTESSTEVEAPDDEAVDGVDHQFEGEEVGNNGDGIPDPNEANEIDSPEYGSEVEAPDDEAVDGVDHQFEGEEVGNNGDGIPDPNEANEEAEATSGG
jgi:hypothetical protein